MCISSVQESVFTSINRLTAKGDVSLCIDKGQEGSARHAIQFDWKQVDTLHNHLR